ncbi:factor cwc22-like protein [Anaeramoeba ignava]|uniref:Factor cwc22-like protein n=1 Tax=Anaeramoeba ignava TaxID=1746090 RepID=A0A9Q0L803_ANAIG|nr:factor cwc22-like protein [Anaeramoeba ignava]
MEINKELDEIANDWIEKMQKEIENKQESKKINENFQQNFSSSKFSQTKPRPPRLGLGASFLPHSQAIKLIGTRDKLRKQIQSKNENENKNENKNKLKK